MSTVSSDLGGKTWAYGSALFADLAFIFTLCSVFKINGHWLSTSLLVSRRDCWTLWQVPFAQSS